MTVNMIECVRSSYRKRLTRRVFTFATPRTVAAAALAWVGVASAGAEPQTPVAPVYGEPIFDGKTLDGWKAVGGGKWSVENGEIVGESGDGSYGWLIYEKKPFADFMVTLECRTEALGNSGIQFRSHLVDGKMYGYQADLDPKPGGATGGVYEMNGREWLAKATAPELNSLVTSDWVQYRIRAIGDDLETVVNGVVAVETEDEPGARSGILAFQVHDGETPVKVRFRKILVQDLGDGGAWKRLFNGRTLDGWHVQGEKDVWRVEKGEIIGELVKPSPYAYLATDKTFGDFELKLQMRFDSQDGNSGVFFRCSFPPQCAKCGEVARELPEDVTSFHCPKCGHDMSLPPEERVHIHGPQAEFAPPGQHTGALYDARGAGWINQDKVTDMMQKMHRFHEWNEFRLKAAENHVRTWLNGYPISDVKGYSFPGQGIIALQLHAGGPMKVRFKDIVIRPAREKSAKRVPYDERE